MTGNIYIAQTNIGIIAKNIILDIAVSKQSLKIGLLLLFRRFRASTNERG